LPSSIPFFVFSAADHDSFRVHTPMTIDSAGSTFYYDRSAWDESAAEAADYQEEGADWRADGFRGGRHSTPKVSYYFPKGVGEYHFGVSL
jgi:hypothetical protein